MPRRYMLPATNVKTYGVGLPANGAMVAFLICAATHALCAAACLPAGTADVTRPSGANVIFTLQALPFVSLQAPRFGTSASSAVRAFLASNAFVAGVGLAPALGTADAEDPGEGFSEVAATGALVTGEGREGVASKDDAADAGGLV